MESEEDGAPKHAEAALQCSSPSDDSASMSWVEVGKKESSLAVDKSPHLAGSSAPVLFSNFDEYSLDSSDDGDEGEGDGMEKMDDVSLDTTFDMGILQSSIEGSKEALDLVVEKEVVMVVGKTGVGKSTLIQGIAGKKIFSSFHEASFSGQTATQSVFDAQDALPNFEIGHAKVSKTRSLNAFLRKDGESEIVYLDSPGLEDTRGVEMDIATCALLSQVAKRCKCLRFVILIHCASLLEDRGSAFRSIIQFSNKFVSDFADSRMSFMFLFTHTDEISGMSNSLHDAKKRLLGEIIQIAGATKDEDVLAVLHFVQKSLKKNYPFADILHPLGTDYATLTCAIEKLRAVSDLVSASSCNLTLSSRMKLEVAVQNLLDRLRAALQSSSPNKVSQVEDVKRTFHYLKEYVDVASVRKGASQSEEIIGDYKRALSGCIESEFSRWASSSSDFEIGNVYTLQESLGILQGLDSLFSAEQWIRSKTENILKLQGEILTRASSCKQFFREFKKLQVWTEHFQESSEIYSVTCKRVIALVNESAKAVAKINPSNLHERPSEEVSLYAEKILVLYGMRDFAEQIPVPEMKFDIECAITVQEKALEDLKQVFQSWAIKAAKLSESQTIHFKEDLKDIASYTRVLESMKAVLEKHEVGINILDETVKASLKSLESDVVFFFTSCCDELKNSSVEPSWEPKLSWMHDTCLSFSEMHGGRWKEMQSSFSAVIDKIKSSLHSTCGELENMSNVTKEHGMRSGQRLGEDFVKYKKCIWFDSYLPQGDAFVANCCISIERVFQESIDEKSAELEQTVNSLHQKNCSSKETLVKLELLLPELEEIDKFVTVLEGSGDVKHPSQAQDSPKEISDLGNASLLAQKCRSHIENCTHHLSRKAKKYTDDWIASISTRKFDSVHSLAQKLDPILADAKDLSNICSIDVAVQEFEGIIDDISGGCEKLTFLVDSELNVFGGDFNLKADILRSIKACSGLLHIGKQLPSYSTLQHKVRNLVAIEAQKLEHEIEASSDWDVIDKNIETFQLSVVLDDFVSQEVSSRLNTLRRLREKKEDHVNDHLQTMIQANNFIGIAEFLAPLAESRDQIKKQKFESYQDEISFNLDLIAKDVNCHLNQSSITDEENLKSIAENMSILVTAKASLQRLLKGKLNIGVRIGYLNKKIDDEIKPLIVRLVQSTAKKDFVRAAENDHQATLVIQYLDSHIKPSTKQKQINAKSKYCQELTNVPNYVEKFSQSLFKDKDDLVRSLASLKQAKDIHGDKISMKALAVLYDTTKRALMEKVREFITTVQESICEAKCFDDVIPLLHSLNRQINGPLKAHFPTALLLECENLLERIQKEKKDHDNRLEFGGKDVNQTIDLWSQELDKLKSPAWYRRWVFSNADRASYKNLKNKLMAKVEARLEQANHALNTCDLRSCQECIEFVALVEKKLQKHIENAGARLRQLRKRCVDSFLALCHQIKDLVEAEEIIRFEEKFADYRGFALHIPHILASKEGKREFALVNQMLYESLVHQIDSFLATVDAEIIVFSDLRGQVLRLRKLGDFFADRVTVLNEEIKQRMTADKWLGKSHDLCSKYFSSGRDLGKLKSCIELGVVPSATASEIKKAYKEKARRCHPDKLGFESSGDAGSLFRKIKDAQDELLSSDRLKSKDRSQVFDDVLKGIGEKLRTLSKHFMEEQRYAMAEKLLFQLPALKEIDNLVTPKLQSATIQSRVCEIIKGHVEKMRVNVDTNWSERKYKDLNESITDLKQMESHFKSYPKIFALSWNTGIIQTIEDEIESLGQKARACLSSHSRAKKKEGDFRQIFIEMGSVLVELPSFKSFTKQVMSNVLESCLDSDWGYGFLFELGSSLQRGDDASDDNTKRIAQMLVSEFIHFKEVMVMTWNQETSQKPVEDVVMHIKGEHWLSPVHTKNMEIDQEELIKSFCSYDKIYKSLLGEYIKPEADLNVLVKKIVVLSQKMQPISCDKIWSEKDKRNIPTLLAGVFSLFTILKSGASYNRIEASAGPSSLGEKLLMKPHNIQVLTILHMFGCGKGARSSIDSQLMQIRTGEGKSMILGAAAAMLALLGFRVRTVCYSDYLSARDYRLFEEVFQRFGVLEDVKYSKITTFAEDSTASRGSIRDLTNSLLRGTLADSGSLAVSCTKADSARKRPMHPTTKISPKTRSKKKQKTKPASKDCSVPCLGGEAHLENGNRAALDLATEGQDTSPKDEILLIDEVDVFFGKDFYGETYNQVIEFKEPEVAIILKRIWDAHSKGGHRLRLNTIKAMSAYKTLLKKMASFAFLLDNEISLMLNQVKRVDDVPYYLDSKNDRIGYKVMDTISFNVTFGYITIFAYLKEANNLKDKATALSRTLVMPVSCGQFSYAKISPVRILGVSGTLEAIGQYEKNVLNSYGLNKFIYVPSVYGNSNFQFDQAGYGISFESTKSNFYHKISAAIMGATKSKRAVIVFFRDRSKLNEFVSSPTYRQLGRHKSLLTEDMSAIEKEYIINQAATSGQITLSTAMFGRGTDFFCKDDSVEKNGGVHVVQTFLSEEVSEEIQIQGRTARQGKQGSYQMILLDSDLEADFGIPAAEKHKVPKNQWYDWLCSARLKHHKEQCLLVERNLQEATERDKMTRDYFNSLLACNEAKSKEQFKSLYQLIKKPPMPSSLSIDLALLIDVTGSMAPYAQSVVSIVNSMLSGQNALTSKLSHQFPDIEFQLRLGCLGFRDIDDGSDQFTELKLNNGSHFTSEFSTALRFVQSICATPSGGFDLAEDIIGAIDYCAKWQKGDDWTSDIKFMMLLSDASTHGLLPKMPRQMNNADNYPVRHPEGLTSHDAVTSMIRKDMDLFFCSFDPLATKRTEDELSDHFKAHSDNTSEHGFASISMVPKDAIVSARSSIRGGYGRHIIFVLDESGSMRYNWSGVVVAYNQYISKRKQSQSDSDLVSVVQFDSRSQITVRQQPLSLAPESLSYNGGGTSFHPAAKDACSLARQTPKSHTPAIIFMSDGQANDASNAAMEFSALNKEVSRSSKTDLELHVIAFGHRVNNDQLMQIAGASKAGKVHASSNTAELAGVFIDIATTQNVSLLLESEVARRISEAVSDKLSLEYFGG